MNSHNQLADEQRCQICFKLKMGHNLTAIANEMWCKHYYTIRPHSSLGYRPPAQATFIVQSSQTHQVGLIL